MMRRSWILLFGLVMVGCRGPADEPKTRVSAEHQDSSQPQAPPPAAEDAGTSEDAELPPGFEGMKPEDAAARGPTGMHQARDVFHRLLTDHKQIERKVEDLPDGVRTVTTSGDPQVAALIRLHVRQMKVRLEAGMGVRNWDPLFAELHKQYDKINFEIEDVPGGVRVVETSEDPQVVLLIRQHAHRGVSEFVERGFDRAREPSPLPEGYQKD